MNDGVPVTQIGFMMVTALGRWHLGLPVLVEMCEASRRGLVTT